MTPEPEQAAGSRRASPLLLLHIRCGKELIGFSFSNKRRRMATHLWKTLEAALRTGSGSV